MLAITDDMRRRLLSRLTYRFPWLYGLRLRWACWQYQRGLKGIRSLCHMKRDRTVIITSSADSGKMTRYIIEGYLMEPDDLGHLTAIHQLKRELETQNIGAEK